MSKPHDDIVYGRTALREGIPWIVPESLEALQAVIQPHWNVFEWGSGGSTTFWARNCSFVVSIEHNPEWITRTWKQLHRHKVDKHRVCLQYCPGIEGKFREYARAILAYPDESFDLVFVDGEASSRGWCLNNALSKVKVGGYLLLDNSDWLKRDLGEDWERQDYVEKDLKWVGQKGTFNWWTSLLRKKQCVD